MSNNTVSENSTGEGASGGWSIDEDWYGRCDGENGLGSGIYNFDTVNMSHTIVAAHAVGGDCFDEFPGGIRSLGYNIDSDNSCSLGDSTDLPGLDPTIQIRLGPLADNGGSTETHALLAGSLAIDAGNNANCLQTDQRGVKRSLDGDLDGSAICDIGAFEFYQYAILGRILDSDGTPMEGVLISADNGVSSAITDIDGYYALFLLPGWSGTVTPKKPNFSFYPPHRQYQGVNEAQVNQDYTCEVVPGELYISLIPMNLVVFKGETLEYLVEITNNKDSQQTIDFWVSISLPDGSLWPENRAFLGPSELVLAANETLLKPVIHNVPGNALSGTHIFNAFVGYFPWTVLDQAKFGFFIIQ